MTEIQLLRDRVEELERVLGVDRSLTSRLRDVFGLEPGLSPILGMLMKRSFVSHSSLYTVLYAGRPECDWPDDKVMDVQICKLRRKLRKHGVTIVTKWGEGWSMPAVDKARVHALLGGAAVTADKDTVYLGVTSPEVASLIDSPPTGYVSLKTPDQYRKERKEAKARRMAFLEGA